MEKEYIIIKESLIDSILSDIFTYSGFFFLLYCNKMYFGDHLLIAFCFVILMIMVAAVKGSKKIKRFNTLEEAKKYINKKT